MRTRSRPAFSVLELVVVLAILLILLGLLLPAVQKVRSASARMQSQNNLKQIGLACHAYLDANGAFPPGNDANHFSAAARLLPYIEQQNLFQTIDFKKPATDPANADARKTQIKVFLSPDDPVQTVKEDSGATNYLFCAGSKASLTDNDGIFYLDSKTGIADVTDGTSNTLLTGETLKGDGGAKALTVSRQYVLLKKADLKGLKEESGVEDFQKNQHIAGDRCASWIDGRFLQGTFAGNRLMNDEKPDVSCEGAGGLSALRGMMGGVNVGMADGSVRFVSKKLDLEVWNHLASRNDGNVIPDF